MKDRHVLTVRFCTDGVEGRLYQRLMEGKRESGLSMPDYVKRILTEYFSAEDRGEEWDAFLEKFHRECLVVLADIEQAVGQALIGQEKATTTKFFTGNAEVDGTAEGVSLPETSTGIPEGALDFLER